MRIFTERAYQERLERERMEMDRRQWENRRCEELQKQIDELRKEIWMLKHPNYKENGTDTCVPVRGV